MLKEHVKTILVHKKHVGYWCFKMGIPWRGIIHDLSKFSIKELSIAKYYTGYRSPHDTARDELGYSPSWLYHRNRNKHHWEYWIDSLEKMNAVKIPYKYVIEMFCDFVGAGKAYMKEKWSESEPLKYHNRTKKKRVYHEDTLGLLDGLFNKLEMLGTDEFFKWYKQNKVYIQASYEHQKGEKIKEMVIAIV